MTKTIRLKDVAEAAGVSHGTASNVFSRPEIVREEVRERVREAARTLGYAGPSPAGRLLRSGKVNAIGFAADQPLHYLFSDPWARRLLTNGPADASGGARLTKVGEGASGEMQIVGLAGTWSVDDSEGGICHW